MRPFLRSFAPVVLIAALAAPFTAQAQDPQPGDQPAAELEAPAPLIAEPAVIDAAKAIFTAITAGGVNKTWLIVVGAVILLVWAVRKFGSLLGPKLAAILNHPVVAFALPTLIGVGGGMLNALLAGKPLQVAALEGLKIAAAAVFAYVGAKKVAEAHTLAKAKAAETVTSTRSALSVHKHGPPA